MLKWIKPKRVKSPTMKGLRQVTAFVGVWGNATMWPRTFKILIESRWIQMNAGYPYLAGFGDCLKYLFHFCYISGTALVGYIRNFPHHGVVNDDASTDFSYFCLRTLLHWRWVEFEANLQEPWNDNIEEHQKLVLNMLMLILIRSISSEPLDLTGEENGDILHNQIFAVTSRYKLYTTSIFLFSLIAVLQMVAALPSS